jgi:hypothetical protein
VFPGESILPSGTKTYGPAEYKVANILLVGH